MSTPPSSGRRSALHGGPQPVPAAPDVVALLERAAGHDSGVTFVDLHEREVRLSWREVRDRARGVAASLRRAGIGSGDRVALVLRTEPAFLDAFFGTLQAGAVPVPLYPPVRLGRFDEYVTATARMIGLARARLLIAGTEVRPLLGEVVARARPPLGCRTTDDLAGGANEQRRPVAPGDLALVQFSSGSTVDPKPVALTHANVVAQTASFLAMLRLGTAETLVSWLPLYHDMGLIGGLLGAMSHPGSAVLIAPEHFLARPALWLRAVSRHRGTIGVAPSFAYDYAASRVRDLDLAGVDLSSWRIALDGAEPISPEALRRFGARFARYGFDARALTPVYGLSEAALAVTFSPPRRAWRSRRVDAVALAARGEVADGPREVVSVGVPLPGVAIEVRDETDDVVPERRLGRIFTRGPSVMCGYLGQPEATARALRDGWLDTGDLGFVDEGELFVHGRAKDVIIVRGANHAPSDIEAALAGIEGVRPGCAVAVAFQPDDGGEALLVLAERSGPRDRDRAVEQQARAAVTQRTGVAPHSVVMLAPGTLPRTSSGKMRRSEALRRYLSGRLDPPRRVTAVRIAFAMMRSVAGYARARLTVRHDDVAAG